MTMQDPLADLLTRIRNAQTARITEVLIPSSRTKAAVAQVLKDEGYIEDFSVSEPDGGKRTLSIRLKYHGGKPVIEEIKRVSRPGLRQYRNKDKIPRLKGGLGIYILSTNKGLMTDRTARAQGIGGELLCSVF
jgi:small subunit ribosomal protein S8